MPARLPVVADAHGVNSASIVLQCFPIAAIPALLDGRLRILVPFEFHYKGGKIRVERTGQEHQISISFPRRKFAEDLVLLPCAIESEAERVGTGVLIVVLDMTGFHVSFLDEDDDLQKCLWLITRLNM